MTDYTPTEQETADEKNRLADLVKPELKEHGLVDLTAFVNKESREGFKHSGFVRSLAYRIEEMGIAEVIPQKEWTEFYIKRSIYSKRHPIIFAAILLAIGVVFSVIAGTTNAFISEQIKPKEPQTEVQELKQAQKDLSDKVINLRHQLNDVQDTLTKFNQR